MKRPRQLYLHKNLKIKREFGGSLLKKSNAKVARPVSTRQAMHVVLKSSKAKGAHSMLSPKNAKPINQIVLRQAKKFHITIYQYANVGNHIHLLVKASARKNFKDFLRAISGLIARKILNQQRGKAKKVILDSEIKESSHTRDVGRSLSTGKGQNFWDQRPFSRIVDWANDFKLVKQYVIQNFKQALGFINSVEIKYYSTA